MSEEKVYFDDEEYLITSCRFLIREDGRTILIKDLSAPYFVETPIEYHKPPAPSFNPIDLLISAVWHGFEMDDTKKWGEFRVVAGLKGKKEILIVQRFYHREGFPNPDSEFWRQSAFFGSPA